MKSYEEILQGYKRRQRDTLVDTICAGLTYADNVAVESGILQETGILTELTETACGVLPFVIIAATEGSKVVLGRKNSTTGIKDCAWRMTKTGVAMGVGGAVAAGFGLWAAIPATMGIRCLFDRYRSKALTGCRVQSRITRLKELNDLLNNRRNEAEEQPADAPLIADIICEGGTIE